MNQIPNIEETNTREIEEVIEQKSLSARDCLPDEEVINASQAVEIFHQELQKVREEERERISKIVKTFSPVYQGLYARAYESGGEMMREILLQAITQSELDQPTV